MEKISFTLDLKEKVVEGLKKIISGFAKVADTVYDLHKHLTKNRLRYKKQVCEQGSRTCIFVD